MLVRRLISFQVRPFVDMFESLISSKKPVWLMQFSSEKEFCSPAPGSSWGCSGSQDHCKTHQPWKQLDSCPTTHKLFLSPGWKQADFQHAAEEVFGKFQDGWTHPWQFINECSEMWIEYKKLHVSFTGGFWKIWIFRGSSRRTELFSYSSAMERNSRMTSIDTRQRLSKTYVFPGVLKYFHFLVQGGKYEVLVYLQQHSPQF